MKRAERPRAKRKANYELRAKLHHHAICSSDRGTTSLGEKILCACKSKCGKYATHTQTYDKILSLARRQQQKSIVLGAQKICESERRQDLVCRATTERDVQTWLPIKHDDTKLLATFATKTQKPSLQYGTGGIQEQGIGP